MLTMPKIVERIEQPYVAITAKVTMREIGPSAETLLPEVFGWLEQRGITPAGAPFFRYNVIDMERQLEIEFGVPTASRSPAMGASDPAGCQPGAMPRWCIAGTTTSFTTPTPS